MRLEGVLLGPRGGEVTSAGGDPPILRVVVMADELGGVELTGNPGT